MQVVFHTGSHGTDDDRLIKCLLSNKEPFSQRGVAVPGPAQYRALFKKVLTALDEAEPEPQAREVLIEAILDGEVADRVIFSDANFFGSHWSALGKGMFYPRAATRMANLQAIFAYDQVEMFMSIRNPASFVPDVLGALPEKGAAEVMEGMDLHKLHWTGMVESIRAAAPNVQLTLWCNEDTPLIWAQLLREMAGLEALVPLKGEFTLLREIMTPAGMTRFESYLAERPGMTEMQKRRVIAAFLDKFADEEAIEEELDLPGWTEDLVERLTELYDDDVHAIGRLPGITLITP